LITWGKNLAFWTSNHNSIIFVLIESDHYSLLSHQIRKLLIIEVFLGKENLRVKYYVTIHLVYCIEFDMTKTLCDLMWKFFSSHDQSKRSKNIFGRKFLETKNLCWNSHQISQAIFKNLWCSDLRHSEICIEKFLVLLATFLLIFLFILDHEIQYD